MSFTYPYATLHNYQNTLIYTSELQTHPTLINHTVEDGNLTSYPINLPRPTPSCHYWDRYEKVVIKNGSGLGKFSKSKSCLRWRWVSYQPTTPYFKYEVTNLSFKYYKIAKKKKPSYYKYLFFLTFVVDHKAASLLSSLHIASFYFKLQKSISKDESKKRNKIKKHLCRNFFLFFKWKWNHNDDQLHYDKNNLRDN